MEIPQNGEVYTIRSVVRTEYGTGIRLKQITNPKFYYSRQWITAEQVFDIRRFVQI